MGQAVLRLQSVGLESTFADYLTLSAYCVVVLCISISYQDYDKISLSSF